MKQLLLVASVGLLGLVTTACEPTSGSAAPSVVTVPPAPAPAPSPSRPVLKPDRLSGVASEITSAGLVPLAGVEIYCDACGEFGHTKVATDDRGAYDFGHDGIWSDGGGVISILINKDGYDVSGGTSGPAGWTWRSLTITGDTRFDMQLVRR